MHRPVKMINRLCKPNLHRKLRGTRAHCWKERLLGRTMDIPDRRDEPFRCPCRMECLRRKYSDPLQIWLRWSLCMARRLLLVWHNPLRQHLNRKPLRPFLKKPGQLNRIP